MKAVMLAAGIGAGLGNSRTLNLTKILLRFDDRSLQQHHIDILKRYGIEKPIRDVLLTFGRETGRMSNCE
jgi:choline kinase